MKTATNLEVFFGFSLLEFGTAVLAAVTWQAWHVQPKKSLGAWGLPSVLSITPWIAQILGFNAAEPNEGCAEVGSEHSAGSWAAGKPEMDGEGILQEWQDKENGSTLMERRDVGKEFKKLWVLHPWKCPRLGLGATWDSGNCPCSW